MSPNCQKSAILYQKLSFGPLKTLFSLHKPIISLVSLQPQYKNGHFDIWNMLGSENFYYCRSRMVWMGSLTIDTVSKPSVLFVSSTESKFSTTKSKVKEIFSRIISFVIKWNPVQVTKMKLCGTELFCKVMVWWNWG